MIEYITKLWKKSKILFFIAIIPVVIILGIKLLLEANARGGFEDLVNAEDTDNDLQNQANDANDKANDHKAKADALEDEINDLKNNKDPNWHEKI